MNNTYKSTPKKKKQAHIQKKKKKKKKTDLVHSQINTKPKKKKAQMLALFQRTEKVV